MNASKPNLQLLAWRDVFALVDDGRATGADYEALAARVIPAAASFPKGVGALIIIPPHATPPRDDARIAMNQLMCDLGSSLRCLCWLVEGSGFQGAMVRAVLTGIKAFSRFPYPCHVSTDPSEALRWIRQQLAGSEPRPGDVEEGVRAIAERRRLLGA